MGVTDAIFGLMGIYDHEQLINFICYSLILPTQESNLADVVLQNALLGEHHSFLCQGATDDNPSSSYRDDISVVVVDFTSN